MKNSSRLLSIIDPIIRTWGSLSIGTRGQFKMGTRGSVCCGISRIPTGEKGPERKRTISLGGGEIPITLFP